MFNKSRENKPRFVFHGKELQNQQFRDSTKNWIYFWKSAFNRLYLQILIIPFLQECTFLLDIMKLLTQVVNGLPSNSHLLLPLFFPPNLTLMSGPAATWLRSLGSQLTDWNRFYIKLLKPSAAIPGLLAYPFQNFEKLTDPLEIFKSRFNFSLSL